MTCPSIHRTAAMRIRPAGQLACNACKTRYDDVAWSELTLVERIAPSDVRRFVSSWPEGLYVEVRRCARCSQSISLKRAASV